MERKKVSANSFRSTGIKMRRKKKKKKERGKKKKKRSRRGNTHNVDTLVSGDTDLGALST